MSKRIKIFANAPLNRGRYALVPFGLYFNRDIKSVRKGDVIVFSEGWRQTRMRLVRKCVLRVNTQVFEFMLRSLYRGWNVPDAFFSHWEAVGISEGFGKNAVSLDEVMMIEVESIDGKDKEGYERD